MPKQKRWAIKRDLDRALEYIGHAQDYCVKWGHEYKEPHPEIYDEFSFIVTLLEAVKGRISELRDKI